MEYWVSIRANKVVEQVMCNDGEDPIWSEDSKGLRKFKADRRGQLNSEVFDKASGTWVEDPEWPAKEADIEAGGKHIDTMHLIKFMEARQLLGLPTFLQMEADALGMDVTALAEIVIQKSDDLVRVEIARRQKKKGVSNG